uniref:Uncharacterized protein n=1 Tax=Rhinolophus ferrumequinum TaxID=59479 RepID=A0A671EUJ9_RHIFE
MSKRKKLRTSGEGINPLKPPKNPRLRDSHGVPQSSELCPLHHPEESEGRSGPAPSVEQRGEEPGQAASSSPDKETGSSSMLLGQPERESVSFPSSQNSVGRFVPQFAKPRKTVTRQAATREEDLGSGAFGLLFPAGSGLGPCWAGTRPLADGSHLTKAQPSAYEGLKPCEAPRMEDATDTVRGLVIELSNLNRLIMTTHRDLEAFKRLNYWKAKPVVKAPLPHTSKGAGTVPHGEPSWKGL